MGIKDIYSFPTLLKVIGALPSPNTYILDTFFQDGEEFETEYVEVQTVKGSKSIAPYVSELQPGKVILRTGFTANQYKPALIKPAIPITSIDLRTRSAGESLINPIPPEVRARRLLAKDIIDLRDAITRRLIQQAAELMFTGKVTQIGEGVSQVIDYDFTNFVTLSGTDLFSNPASDPIKFLTEWRQMIVDKEASTPDVVLTDYNTAVSIVRHPKILELAKNDGLDIGKIDTTLLPRGVTYHGYLRDVGVHIYSYTGKYTNDENKEVPFIPAGTLAMLSSQEKFSIHYGANIIMDKKTEEFMRVMGKITPQTWVTIEPAQRWLQMLSRPLAVPANVDGWVVAKVL
ncbi:major capsid protein [Paenibacillus agilis]|uniref:Major capsid protein n=1 Tax=Paenibacillus agilis TaxID=3020863 RepID=A0A559IZI7_9BACL|nr:major capsid protein [Paenibacillus agilis]TVX93041.1 major capsid protein [Paenibacillus agilis]